MTRVMPVYTRHSCNCHDNPRYYGFMVQGLSSVEASQRLVTFGYNELEKSRPKNIWKIAQALNVSLSELSAGVDVL